MQRGRGPRLLSGRADAAVPPELRRPRGHPRNAQASIRQGGVEKIGNLYDTGSGGKAKFKEKSFAAQGAAGAGLYHTCAIGRPHFGACTQPMKMLVDDWGMSNGYGDEASICPVLPLGIPCFGLNMPYWYSINKLYTPMSLLFGVQAGMDCLLISSVYGRVPMWIPLISRARRASI